MDTLPPLVAPPEDAPVPPPRRRLPWRRFAWGLGATLLTFAGLAAALAYALLRTLTPGPGEWSQVLRIGPFERPVSVPALIRMATHPLGRRWLHGQRLATRLGTLHWQLEPDGETLVARCAPCTLRLPGLGLEPLQWPRAELRIRRRSQNDFHGELRIGTGEPGILGRWTAGLAHEGMDLRLDLAEAPIADYYRLFETGIPELARARIEGQARFELQARLPRGRVQLRPLLNGFAVSGLGTEALLDATPPARCQAPARQAGDFGRWLPMAVLSAEDQRFHEHPGYDLAEIEAAWELNQSADGPLRGGSTLTQQLAKILYTGDDRSHLRKLRELLYAVEMERTLGKARILQLYLSIAPWGEGECGAHAAARRWLGKRVTALTPVEAAWLASLLRHPDAAIRAWRDSGQIDQARVAQVIAGLRPTRPSWRRAQLETLQAWTPPPYPAASAPPVAAPVGRPSPGKSQSRTK